MAEVSLKLCLVGPCKTGKSLLARALAEQPLLQADFYQPTAAVRIQEFARTIGVDRLKVQLWDCSGSQQYQNYWQTLSKGIDGIVMVMDAQSPEQEKDLEALYMAFAQPNSLTIKACLVVGLQVFKEGAQGLLGFAGLQGKLSKLNQVYVCLNPANPSTGLQDVYPALDKLLTGCWTQKKYAMEQQVMSEPHDAHQHLQSPHTPPPDE